MQKYLDQIQKYIDAQTLIKSFLSDDQNDLFFLKQIDQNIFLYQLDLSRQGSQIDLSQAEKVLDQDFSKLSLEFKKYFSNLGYLYISLDKANNEFNNLFRIDLKTKDRQLMQITNVKAFFAAEWTRDHKTMYYMNRVPIEQGLFLTEFFKFDFQSNQGQKLFDDSRWQYKVGWSRFLLSECETAVVIGVDYLNRRELTNVIRLELNKLSLDMPEQRRLLDQNYEDCSLIIKRPLTKNGFYFISDFNKFENLYYYNFYEQNVEVVTDEKWVSISYEDLVNKDKRYIVFAEPIKNKNQSRLVLIDLQSRHRQEKVFKGNWIVGQNCLINYGYDTPPTYYIYDNELQTEKSWNKYQGDQLVHCTYEEMSFTSFDGEEIFSYLVRPNAPMKAVAIQAFYGGENYYHMHDQLLLENGVGIFSPAVRGSWGWGREWEDKLKGDLGGKEILDVISAARFIAKKLNFPENKVGVIGASHGGYATLRTITMPKIFENIDTTFNFGFAICECGFADLEDFFKTSRIADWLVDLLGSYPEMKQLYKERSPIHFFENLKTPLFIRHGTTDSRVPFSTMEKFIEALSRSQLIHDILVQEDQGHHTNEPTKLKIERARILKFLEKTIN